MGPPRVGQGQRRRGRLSAAVEVGNAPEGQKCLSGGAVRRTEAAGVWRERCGSRAEGAGRFRCRRGPLAAGACGSRDRV